MAYSPATQNPYELWTTHKLLGVFRDSRPEDWAFADLFPNVLLSTDEWIDFEKLPVRSRTMAQFVKPMGRGHGVFTDKVTGFRFKPANIVVEDAVDPLRPLSLQPGIDPSMLHADLNRLSPMQRLSLIKAAMVAEFQDAVRRRWEWMRCRAIADGQVTLNYLDGDSVTVDFQRAAGHTITLTSGNRWGDSGVSIFDFFQSVIDTMTDADFGAMPTKVIMGGNAAKIMRKDAEVLQHMDVNIRGAVITVDRGPVAGGGERGNGKVWKFGELMIGGASGRSIELWQNDETYDVKNATTGAITKTRYIGASDVIFMGSAESIMGYSCFGMIVDKDAQYQAIPMFPKNFETGERTKVENISIESAPLFVPINPNATLKATVA